MAQTARKGNARSRGGTADSSEIGRFAAIAEAWWDPEGDFRPLHRLNPVRLAFIRDHVCAHFGRDALGAAPLEGLSVLDIGCGGGLLAEPVRRLGAAVRGIDAGQEAIAIARAHAEQGSLDIAYDRVLPEDLGAEKGRYDAVLNMEVVEHVADLGLFLEASAKLVKPGGVMVVSTLNRTLKSLVLAKVGAEYVLRWLPVGTHDWRKFVRPSELAAGLRPHGVEIRKLRGLTFRPLADEWSLSDDLDVNYLAFAVRD